MEEPRFSERLAELIKLRGLDQKKAAVKTNLSPATLSSYLSGDTEPSLSRLKDIARGLKTTVAYLTFETNNPELLEVIKVGSGTGVIIDPDEAKNYTREELEQIMKENEQLIDAIEERRRIREFLKSKKKK